MPFIRKRAYLSGQNLIFLSKQKKVTAFQGLSVIFYITISTKPLWSSGILRPSFSLQETHGSSPTTTVETMLFIMHGCISIHQISNSPTSHPLTSRLLKYTREPLKYSTQGDQKLFFLEVLVFLTPPYNTSFCHGRAQYPER